jgi:surface protein
MSINVASQTGINNGRRNAPPVYNYPVTETIPTYTRPSDWLAMPAVTNTEQKIVLLYAVFNDDSNILGISCNTNSGNFNIDWGDGTSTFSGASATIASHKFDWNNVSAGTLTTRGYRQVLITITPASGNLTAFNMAVKYVETGTIIPAYTHRVLESIISGPFLTSILHGSGATQVPGLMEQSQILSTGTNCSLGSCYAYAYSLQNIVGISANLGTITNTNTMFQSCNRLVAAPLFNTANVVTMASMFANCFNLLYIPSYVLTSCTNLVNTFNTCIALVNAPILDTSVVQNMAGMFGSCIALTNIPLYDTRNVTNMSQMFQNASAIKNCPNFNTIKVTTMASMFNGCQSLQTVPLFNYAACTTTSSMFTNCYSLKSIPPLYLPVVQNISLMFQNCYGVVSIGTLTTGTALTNITQAFIQCRSLINLPLITNTINCTSLLELVYNANSLVNVSNIALYNTSNVTNMTSVFAYTPKVKTIPTFTTTKANTMFSMFFGCGVVNAPSLDTSNVANMASMFNIANSLVTVPTYNTSKVTDISTMLQGTQSLQSVPAFDTSNVTNFTTFLYQSGAQYFEGNLNTSKGTTFTNFIALNLNLQSIPAFNMANATTIGAAFNNNQNLGNFNPTNIKVTTSFANSLLNVTALQGIFTNSILSNNTTQTITITGNPGATNSFSRTATWNNASNVMTMANTVSLTVGSQVSNTANVNLSYAGTLTSNKVSVASVIDDNVIVSFTSVTTSNALANTLYYTSNRAGAGPYTYDISTVQGATPNTFTNGTANMRVNLLVTTVNTNANVILNAYPAGNGTATAVTTRTLNTNLAAYKGWTVTG